MSDEANTELMDSMLHSLFQAVYAGDKNGDVLKLLITKSFHLLSEDQKVHVLTRIEPENTEECVQRKSEPSKRMVESDKSGLLGFIIRLDRVYCLRTVLPLLPLYSVYEREVISPKIDTDDQRAREILYENKATWEIPVTTCETIETMCKDISIASEIIVRTRHRFDLTKAILNKRVNRRYVSGGFPHNLLASSGTVLDKFERLRQALIVLSMTDGHAQSKAAIEAINTARECFVQAERIMSSIWDRFTTCFKLDGLNSENVEEKISDVNNVLQDIKTVMRKIEKGKHNVEILGRGKKRAREEDELESDHKKQATQDSFWKLKREAFILITAHIFVIVSKYKATQCAKLLLDHAPDFVHVEVEGKLPLASLLTSSTWCRQIVDMLVQHGARVGRIDQHDFAEIFTQNPTQHDSSKRDSKIPDNNEVEVDGNEEAIHFHWYYVVKLIIDDNKDFVKTYRDPQGNTLLHILIAQLHLVQDRYRDDVSEALDFRICVDNVLELDINPSDRNIAGQSVLHVLLDSLHQFPKLSGYCHFYELIQDLAPYFRDAKMQDENLLQNLFAAHEHGSSAIKHWINAYQSIMEHNVMDLDFLVNSGRTPWQIVLGGHEHSIWHWSVRGSNMTLCLQLSDMCKLAIQKGCNISRSIDAVATNLTRISDSVYRPTVSGNGELMVGPLQSDNDCCYLTLLKVLLSNGADIRPLLKLDPANAHIVTFIRMISDPESEHYDTEFHARLNLTILEMYKICKAFVLYNPDCCEHLVNSLMKAANIQQQSDIRKQNEMTQKLHQLLSTPRSLQFLAKRSILRGMQRKQVDRLPLPTAIKVYIQEDETEKDETN